MTQISQPLIDKVSAAIRQADDKAVGVPYEMLAQVAIETVIAHIESGGK